MPLTTPFIELLHVAQILFLRLTLFTATDYVQPPTLALAPATSVDHALCHPDRLLSASVAAQASFHYLTGVSRNRDLAIALGVAAMVHQHRREEQAARARAEALIKLATEQGSPYWVGYGTALRGWALAEQGQEEEGIAQVRRGIAIWQDTGTEIGRTYFLALLAEACGKSGQAGKGLAALIDAPASVEKTGDRRWEAEVYRLRGELMLAQFRVQSLESRVKEAEECFHKAIEIARKQQAKSLELRAATSLARLWQQQGKTKEAHEMLLGIYGWFTEGFDTKDLQEAKMLIEELSH